MTRYTKLEGRRTILSASGQVPQAVHSSLSPPTTATITTTHENVQPKPEPEPEPEPVTKERLLKKAKLLKLKAKKSKTKESKRNFLKRAWDLEAESDRLEHAQLAAKRQKSWTDREQKREARRQARVDERMSKLKCFACRAFGHAAKHCPQALDANSTSLDHNIATMTGSDAVGICFKCGSTQHTLATCKNSGDQLPFATCFICSQIGHLSSKCPKNQARGVYPDGGSCKLCQSVQHLARDCPLSLRRNAQPHDTDTLITHDTMTRADEDHFHTLARIRGQVDTQHLYPPHPHHQPISTKPPKKVVSF